MSIIKKQNLVAFKTKNESMNGGRLYDTPKGADIQAVALDNWQEVLPKSVYGFILLTQKGIYHKDIKNYNKETGMLTLSARNKECKGLEFDDLKFPDFEFPVNEVIEVLKVIKRSF